MASKVDTATTMIGNAFMTLSRTTHDPTSNFECQSNESFKPPMRRRTREIGAKCVTTLL
jgi:hypothetical protein